MNKTKQFTDILLGASKHMKGLYFCNENRRIGFLYMVFIVYIVIFLCFICSVNASKNEVYFPYSVKTNDNFIREEKTHKKGGIAIKNINIEDDSKNCDDYPIENDEMLSKKRVLFVDLESDDDNEDDEKILTSLPNNTYENVNKCVNNMIDLFYSNAYMWRLAYIFICIFLVLFAGISSGLTTGFMAFDELQLLVLKESGSPEERIQACTVLSLLTRRHQLLVTLLLSNCLAMETLPLFLDRLMSPVAAVLLAVTFVLFFGEILPQAFCTGRRQLQIAYLMAPLVRFMLFMFALIAKPIAVLMDKIFKEKEGTVFYGRSQIRALIGLHHRGRRQITGAGIDKADDVDMRSKHFDNDEKEADSGLHHDEVLVIQGALDMAQKDLHDILVPLNDVYKLECKTKLTPEILQEILRRGHSRIPIYEECCHNIRAILLVKSLIGINPHAGPVVSWLKQYGLGLCIEDVVRRSSYRRVCSPIFVSPLLNPYQLLNEFQTGGSHLAFVTNDYIEYRKSWNRNKNVDKSCRILGIVTLEDVIEELIQEDIEDEFDVDVRMRRGMLGRGKSGRDFNFSTFSKGPVTENNWMAQVEWPMLSRGADKYMHKNQVDHPTGGVVQTDTSHEYKAKYGTNTLHSGSSIYDMQGTRSSFEKSSKEGNIDNLMGRGDEGKRLLNGGTNTCAASEKLPSPRVFDINSENENSINYLTLRPYYIERASSNICDEAGERGALNMCFSGGKSIRELIKNGFKEDGYSTVFTRQCWQCKKRHTWSEVEGRNFDIICDSSLDCSIIKRKISKSVFLHNLRNFNRMHHLKHGTNYSSAGKRTVSGCRSEYINPVSMNSEAGENFHSSKASRSNTFFGNSCIDIERNSEHGNMNQAASGFMPGTVCESQFEEKDAADVHLNATPSFWLSNYQNDESKQNCSRSPNISCNVVEDLHLQIKDNVTSTYANNISDISKDKNEVTDFGYILNFKSEKVNFGRDLPQQKNEAVVQIQTPTAQEGNANGAQSLYDKKIAKKAEKGDYVLLNDAEMPYKY